MNKPTELLPGTLDMLVLKAVSLGKLHGYGILSRIQKISKEALQLPQGSLHPALYRLEHKGWVSSIFGASENNRKAKYYSIIAAGSKQLSRETQQWSRLTGAISNVLNTVPGES